MDQNQLFADLVRKILCDAPDAQTLEDISFDLQNLRDALDRRFADVDLERVAEILRTQHASLLSKSPLARAILNAMRVWDRDPRPEAKPARTTRDARVRRAVVVADGRQLALFGYDETG